MDAMFACHTEGQMYVAGHSTAVPQADWSCDEPQFLLGDFYGGETPVTRGVCLAGDSCDDTLLGGGFLCQTLGLDYHKDNKLGFSEEDLGGDLTCIAIDFHFPDIEDGPDSPFDYFGVHHATSPIAKVPATPAAVFVLGARAPRLSDQPFREVEATTVELQTFEPARLGNTLQDFLFEICGVVSVKVSREKFAIKAELTSGLNSCVVKLRIYEVAPGSFAVEMQRRRGDAVFFVQIFRKLSQYLKVHGFAAAPCNNC